VDSTCGHDGNCDGNGSCSFVSMGTPVGQKTCAQDDAGRGVACLTQSCDGQGGVTCDWHPCSGMCMPGVGCIEPDAGGETDAATEASDSARDATDVATDAPPDATPSDAGRDAGATIPCTSQADCVAPAVCHLEGYCGPGRPGERCWPPGSDVTEMPSVFTEDGQCLPGTPTDPTEIVGRCSVGSRVRGGGWEGFVAVIAGLGVRRLRRRRRISTER
jgi:hypothetical protein